MIFLKLDTLDNVTELTKICAKYESVNFDILHGRYIINGKSVLGVSSLIGNIVKIVPDTNDNLLLEYIIKDLKEIGAWQTN